MTTQAKPRSARSDEAAGARDLAKRAWPRLRPLLSPTAVALGVIVGAGLALRLSGIDHGLPFVYHVDEARHFTNRAIAMFGGDFNPDYFDNPSAFTYLVHLVLRFQYGGLWPFGDLAGLVSQLDADPTGVYVTARSVATVLCMLAVVALFAVGRRLWATTEGLVAAAILSFAFLPVAYSRFALNDVGVLLPMSIAIYGIVRAREDGRWRYFILSGAAIGVAVGFKYTAGVIVAPLLVAAALRARREPKALAGAGLSLLVAALAFFVTTPYFVLELGDALRELGSQGDQTDRPKPGQRAEHPLVFYAGSLTWGLGVGAAIAAVGGLVWELRRDPVRALLLALVPVLLVLYLAGAERFFARWWMPAYPMLALLAGIAIARLSRRVSSRPALRAGALALLVLAVLAQPLAADVRTARLFAREDTRQIARDFLVSRFPPWTRMVIEPSVPPSYHRGRFRRGFRLAISERYTRALRPSLIDRYRRAGYCTVVTMSTIRGRAEIDRDPQALAYYRRLERESRLLFEALPYREGAGRVPFDFESLLLYYPRAFERPGPEVKVYRLDACSEPARPSSAAPQPPGP